MRLGRLLSLAMENTAHASIDAEIEAVILAALRPSGPKPVRFRPILHGVLARWPFWDRLKALGRLIDRGEVVEVKDEHGRSFVYLGDALDRQVAAHRRVKRSLHPWLWVA